MKSYLLIKHLRVHNANALSSPYTIGFPAMTAWLGAVHALQRGIQIKGMSKIFLTKTAVSCHKFRLHSHRGKGDYVNSIIGTANPLKKDGERAAFIEEARCDMEISLLIEVIGVDGDNKVEVSACILEQLNRMKMAGGDILSFNGIELYFIDGENEQQERALIRRLMPGYVLVERRDLMTHSMAAGKDALEALLEHLQVVHHMNAAEVGSESWNFVKKEPGWLVPIAVGFQGISELGKVRNQRDEQTLHRFAESVVTLGEFKMPYRFKNIDEMMWHYSADPEQNLYVCENQQ